MLPKLWVRSVYDIDLEELNRMGIRGILADLDNTLVGAKEAAATPELGAWLTDVRSSGLKVAVISNNAERRVRAFAEPLQLPFVSRARKPLGGSFVKALAMLELRPEEAAIVGDQMMTDVLGGNRLGLYTILVDPIARTDEGWMTRHVNRNLERAFLRRLRKKGWL